MKRILVVFISLLVAIPLVAGIMAGLAYYTTDEASVPSPVLRVLGSELDPTGYTWHEPVFGGMLYRDFEKPATGSIRAGRLEVPTLELAAPEGYATTVRLLLNNEEVWRGTEPELAAYHFVTNGDYKLRVDCEREDDGQRGYGTLSYECGFTVAVEPRVEVSDEWVAQGDVVALKVFNLPIGMEPAATTDLGEVRFSPTEDGGMVGFVPIGHAREPTIYNVLVEAAGQSWEVPIRVIETNFVIENVVVQVRPDPELDPIGAMLWDMAPPEEHEVEQVGQASPAEYGEYIEKIRPLFDMADEATYWTGLFTEPIKGETPVQYGMYTYRTDEERPLRQSGVGYSAPEGAPILAPNSGKVIFAQETEDCGLAVVIEHGGGLKSLFFFMGTMDVEEGDMVMRDQKIGEVGAGGFSKDAGVYYEARLGYETINPSKLFDGSCRLYFFS